MQIGVCLVSSVECIISFWKGRSVFDAAYFESDLLSSCCAVHFAQYSQLFSSSVIKLRMLLFQSVFLKFKQEVEKQFR